MKLLEAILSEIDNSWEEHEYNLDRLPSICEEKIMPYTLHESVETILSSRPYKQLVNCKPHSATSVITLAETPNLKLYIHFWHEFIGTPHHHAWDGFFMNLKGTVIHSTYDFEETETIDPHLSFGKISTKNIELLLPGDSVQVYSGKRYIHGLWHIDFPCISLSVRSKRSKSNPNEITLDYDKLSGVVMCKTEIREDVNQLFKWLHQFGKTDEAFYYSMLDDLISTKDPNTVFLLLNQLIMRFNDLGLADHIRSQNYTIEPSLRKRYIDFSESLARNELFIDIRSDSNNFDTRALFGALYVADNLDQILNIITMVFPTQSPEEKLNQLIFSAISTPEIEHSSISLKEAISNYINLILAKNTHKDSVESAISKTKLTPNDKELFVGVTNGINVSLIFNPLFK